MSSTKLILTACVGVAVLTGCAGDGDPPLSDTGQGAGPSWDEFRAHPPMTWETFVARTPREASPPYRYIVDGDIGLPDEQQLRQFYEAWLTQEYAAVAHDGSALTVRHAMGADVLWPPANKFNLTYCISYAFGENWAAVERAMDAATRSWSDRVAVRFVHVPDQDATCTSDNTNVVFNVSPTMADMFAMAFPPDAARANRQLLITPAAFTTTDGGRDLEGILRHETGHILGFRHEHIWIDCGSESTSDARQVTSYDVNSVMHYPECRPSGTGGYRQTVLDYAGATLLYGYASHAGTTLDVNRDGNLDPVWQEPQTGAIFTAGAEGDFYDVWTLSWPCNLASGCASAWRPIATGDFNYDGQADLLWFNPQTGVVSPWLLDGPGVTGTQDLDSRCDAASGCSAVLRPVGTGDFNGDGRVDLLWHNTDTGELIAWLLDGGTVLAKLRLNPRCDTVPGCSATSRVVAVGDFDDDGRTDVMWHDPQTGKLTAWLLDGAGYLKSTQDLTWICSAESGCATDWKVAGSADIDHDGHLDLLWLHPATHEVFAWLLDGAAVRGTMPVWSACSLLTPCSSQAFLVGTAE